MSPHSWYISSNTYLDIQYVCPRVLGAYMGSMHTLQCADRMGIFLINMRHMHAVRMCRMCTNIVCCAMHMPLMFFEYLIFLYDQTKRFSVWMCIVYLLYTVYCTLYSTYVVSELYILFIWTLYAEHMCADEQLSTQYHILHSSCVAD